MTPKEQEAWAAYQAAVAARVIALEDREQAAKSGIGYREADRKYKALIQETVETGDAWATINRTHADRVVTEIMMESV